MGFFAHPTAVIDQPCQIGEGTKIWHFAHICAGAQIGDRCVFGQNSMVAPGVKIGSNVKVQNNVAIYTGTTIEDDVFLGPSCVLTNVTNPRAQVVRHSLYEKTLIRQGATVGANATILCGITLGRYCFISAGAVVSKDVPDYALMVGVPARQKGWMSRHGHPLKPNASGELICPESKYRYQLDGGVLHCLDLAEESALPAEMAVGQKTYDEFKKTVLSKQELIVRYQEKRDAWMQDKKAILEGNLRPEDMSWFHWLGMKTGQIDFSGVDAAIKRDNEPSEINE